MNLENGKGSSLSLPTLGLGPLPSQACFPPLPPFFLLAAAQCPASAQAPAQAQQAARPSPRSSRWQGGPAPRVTARRGHLSDPSSTRNQAGLGEDPHRPRANPADALLRTPRGLQIASSASPATPTSTERHPPRSFRRFSPPRSTPKAIRRCRVLATVSDLPTFSSLLRSRRDISFAFLCFLRVPNPRRTSLQSRRPPSSVASTSEPLPDIVLALGEFASSSSTPWCNRFAFYRPKSRKSRAPTITGHGAAAACPTLAGQLLFPLPDLISTIQVRSNGLYQRIPFGRTFCKRAPRVFKYVTRDPKRFLCLRFLSLKT